MLLVTGLSGEAKPAESVRMCDPIHRYIGTESGLLPVEDCQNTSNG
jgi:hypothetical protein